jgi:hypothetical protein
MDSSAVGDTLRHQTPGLRGMHRLQSFKRNFAGCLKRKKFSGCRNNVNNHYAIAKQIVILRSAHLARVSKDGPRTPWFETPLRGSSP